ncbi:uncharacterized protein [Nicotiana tomentosiformis]|uniref:uncharacterized protein n=1 Tax=Nicotiana tomentosiformis TaxID=4098 RepID=UPI00388CEB7A
MAPFEALYGWQCRSPISWFEPGKARLYGTDLVTDALDKVKFIQERHCTAHSRQKSYTDQKVHYLSFMVEEKFFLKVLPIRDIMMFRIKGKLSPRFIGPFEVLERVGEVAYKLVLPSQSIRSSSYFPRVYAPEVPCRQVTCVRLHHSSAR